MGMIGLTKEEINAFPSNITSETAVKITEIIFKLQREPRVCLVYKQNYKEIINLIYEIIQAEREKLLIDNYTADKVIALMRIAMYEHYSIEDIKTIVSFCKKEHYSQFHFDILFKCLNHRLPADKIKFCLDETIDKSARYEILNGLLQGLEIKYIKLYASLPNKQRQREIKEWVFNAFKDNLISKEDALFYIGLGLNTRILSAIREALLFKIPREKIDKCIRSKQSTFRQFAMIKELIDEARGKRNLRVPSLELPDNSIQDKLINRNRIRCS